MKTYLQKKLFLFREFMGYRLVVHLRGNILYDQSTIDAKSALTQAFLGWPITFIDQSSEVRITYP